MGDLRDDSALVAGLRRRKPGAFDDVYRLYRDPLWRFVRQLAGGKDAAEELFQETWVAAARNAHAIHETTRLVPWLFTIARNKHRNGLRSRAYDRRQLEGAELEPRPSARLPDAEVDERRSLARVADAMACLPEAYREVLVLSTIDELGSEEIGRVLELSPEAVRKRLSRARAELIARLEREVPS